jgi:hypothetical protein
MPYKDREHQLAYLRAWAKAHPKQRKIASIKSRIELLELKQGKIAQLVNSLQNQFLPSSKRIKLS